MSLAPTGPDSLPPGNPYVDAVRAFIKGVKLLDALPFGDSAIQQANRRAARAAGYTGTREQLNAIGQGLRSNFPTGDRPGPGPPRGPSAADRASALPPAVVLGSRVLPPLIEAFGIGVVLPPIIAGVLGWPTAAGKGSDLRDYYAKNKPAVRPKGPRTRGRRRRARPRAAARPRSTIPPAVVPGRRSSGAVTISRPRSRVVSPPVAVTIPRPQSLPKGPPVIKTGPITASAPARIPRTVTQVLSSVVNRAVPIIAAGYQVLSNPLFRATSPTPGRITLPSVGPSPLPLPALAAQPLTSFQRAVAQSPALDLDRACRERAQQRRKKRKPKERNVCYRGTFIETKRGLKKRRKEKVPCQESSRKKLP